MSKVVEFIEDIRAVDSKATTADVTTALESKASAVHTHTTTDINGLDLVLSNIDTALEGKANTTHSHAISDVTNLQTALDGKQATLVSGTNIKTINGTSVLGSGDIITPITTVNNTLTSTSTTQALSAAMGKQLQDSKQATLVSGTNIKTINNNSLLGSGNLVTPTTTVNNTLTSTSTTEALSAAQGKVLQDGKQATLVSGTNIKTINGATLLGSGNMVVGASADYQEFTTSGTWTKPAGINYVYVEMINGGGGGRATPEMNSTVSGGVGGAFLSLMLSASSLPSSVSVVVGAGGVGEIRTTTSGNDANTTRVATGGGISSFGSYSTPLIRGPAPSGDNKVVPLDNQGLIYLDRTAFNTINGGGAGGTIYPSGTTKTTVGTSLRHGNGGSAFYVSGFYNTSATGGNGFFPGGGGGAVNFDATNANVTATGGNGANGVVRVWCW